MSAQRLALGTVQLGLPYGIANRSGQMDAATSASLLSAARRAGVDTLDTAAAYGDSERRLGEIGVQAWRVVTKLPPAMPDGGDAATWVESALRASLERLCLPRVHALLMHRSEPLLGSQGPALVRGLELVRAAGLVERVGVSIYDPSELEALWPHFRPDIVQVPLNILDRRLISSGWSERLVEAGVEVHVRSVFLQGLLLMAPHERPTAFGRWERLWQAWDAWLDESRQTRLRACLGFVLAQPGIARAVVGVDDAVQLNGILAATEQAEAQAGSAIPTDLVCDDLDLINPARWQAA